MVWINDLNQSTLVGTENTIVNFHIKQMSAKNVIVVMKQH